MKARQRPLAGGRQSRMRACDAALQILLETGEPTIMYGDEWLAHQVGKRLGWEPAGPHTTRRVLAALARTPGRLLKSLVRMPSDCCARGQSALCFELPADLRSSEGQQVALDAQRAEPSPRSTGVAGRPEACGD